MAREYCDYDPDAHRKFNQEQREKEMRDKAIKEKKDCWIVVAWIFGMSAAIFVMFILLGAIIGSADALGWHKGECTVVRYSNDTISTNIFSKEDNEWQTKTVWRIYWHVYYHTTDYPRIQNKINEPFVIGKDELYPSFEMALTELEKYEINHPYICNLYYGGGTDDMNVYQANGIKWEYGLNDGHIVAVFGAVMVFVCFMMMVCVFIYIYYEFNGGRKALTERKMQKNREKEFDTKLKEKTNTGTTLA